MSLAGLQFVYAMCEVSFLWRRPDNILNGKNPADNDGLLLKHQVSLPFPVYGYRRQLYARETSLLSRAVDGVVSQIRWGNEALFLSNGALGATP